MRNPKDFWAGLLFLGIGVAGILIALAGGYEVGTARKMGPGYFPIWLGGGLSLIGLALCWRGLATFGAPLGGLAWAPLALVTVGTLVFGLSISRLGLPAAIMLLVALSAYASVRFRWSYALPLGAGLAIASVLIFVKGLGLPMPIMPLVLGY